MARLTLELERERVARRRVPRPTVRRQAETSAEPEPTESGAEPTEEGEAEQTGTAEPPTIPDNPF